MNYFYKANKVLKCFGMFFVLVTMQLPVKAEQIKDFQPNEGWLTGYQLMNSVWTKKITSGGATTLKTPTIHFNAGDTWAGLCYETENLNTSTVVPAVWHLNYPGVETVSRRYSTRFQTNAGALGSWTIALERHQETVTCELRHLR